MKNYLNITGSIIKAVLSINPDFSSRNAVKKESPLLIIITIFITLDTLLFLKMWRCKDEDIAFGPITSWQIDEKTMETVTNFIFLGSKIKADGDCSHEIKRCLLLGRKPMTNLDSVFKSRDITLSTKVCIVKAMFFPVFMYRCESWTIKKDENRRIDAFKLCCWRRLLRAPCTARRSKQSILKEINPEYSREGLKLKLQSWCEVNSLERTLMLGNIKGRRTRERQRMRWLDDIIDSMDMSLRKLSEIVEDRGAWHAAVQEVTKSRTWLNDWTTKTTFDHRIKYKDILKESKWILYIMILNRQFFV